MEKPWFKHVVEGNPKEMEIPEISLPQLFSETVTKYASHTAMTFFNQTYTYTQLDKQIKRLSSAMHKIGEIGRASCRERVKIWGGDGAVKRHRKRGRKRCTQTEGRSMGIKQ